MITPTFLKILLRYGKILADFEVMDCNNRYYRVRVFEHAQRKFFSIMCNGELIELKEI